jgi:GNAT superfamily N-acetyltransferase
MTIVPCDTDELILATRDVMRQLRPHIAPDDYLCTVRRMMSSDGFRLAAAMDGGEARGVAGYRIIEMLAYGRILSVDDLVTDERCRSGGVGARLLDWLKREAALHGCAQLHLDSRVHREGAHRFYFREGMSITAFHFSIGG